MLERVQDDLNRRVSTRTCVAEAVRVRVHMRACLCEPASSRAYRMFIREIKHFAFSLSLYATRFASGHNCDNLILFCPFPVKFIIIHENCNNPLSNATL